MARTFCHTSGCYYQQARKTSFRTVWFCSPAQWVLTSPTGDKTGNKLHTTKLCSTGRDLGDLKEEYSGPKPYFLHFLKLPVWYRAGPSKNTSAAIKYLLRPSNYTKLLTEVFYQWALVRTMTWCKSADRPAPGGLTSLFRSPGPVCLPMTVLIHSRQVSPMGSDTHGLNKMHKQSCGR